MSFEEFTNEIINKYNILFSKAINNINYPDYDQMIMLYVSLVVMKEFERNEYKKLNREVDKNE